MTEASPSTASEEAPAIYKLPPEVVFRSVSKLSEEQLSAMGATVEDVILMRPGAREGDQLISSDIADFLHNFSEPSSVVDALVKFVNTEEEKAEEVLEEVYPIVKSLVAKGFLVQLNDDKDEPQTFELGSQFADKYEIVQLIRKLEDTEIYRVRFSDDESEDSSEFVLKICRRPTRRMVSLISREVAILQKLEDASYTPNYVEHGVHEGRPFVLMSYLAAETSQSLTDRLIQLGSPEAVIDICRKIIANFDDLGARGVMHGDVHPGNIMVSQSGDVYLIDFGQARTLKGKLAKHSAGRGAVDIYYEPEVAAAICAEGKDVPPASEKGQQFTVAAMIYRMLTGTPHLKLPPLREELFSCLQDQSPRPFPKAVNWRIAKLEPVLKKALSSKPTDRFTSFSAFRKAFEKALADEKATQHATHEKIATAYFERLTAPHKRMITNNFFDPWCTLNNGMVGVSFAFQTLAKRSWGHRGTSIAGAWLKWAEGLSGNEQAFMNRHGEISVETVGRVTPFHTQSGVHYANACLAASQGDLHQYKQAIDSFTKSIDAPCDDWDLTLGWAGVTLALAFMVCSGRDAHLPEKELQAVKGLLHERVGRQESWLASLSEPASLDKDEFLGVAHGQLGQIHAILCGHQMLGTKPDSICCDRLDNLVECAVPMGDALCWPRTGGGFHQGYCVHVGSSWCNGTAGYAMVFANAAKIFDRADYEEVALRAGLHAMRNDIKFHDLCCGSGGVAYAMLALFRLTKNKIWLNRARQVADRTAQYTQSFEPSGALYKGELGAMLLQLDLADPDNARMPCFELP